MLFYNSSLMCVKSNQCRFDTGTKRLARPDKPIEAAVRGKTELVSKPIKLFNLKWYYSSMIHSINLTYDIQLSCNIRSN